MVLSPLCTPRALASARKASGCGKYLIRVRVRVWVRGSEHEGAVAEQVRELLVAREVEALVGDACPEHAPLLGERLWLLQQPLARGGDVRLELVLLHLLEDLVRVRVRVRVRLRLRMRARGRGRGKG